MPSELSREKHDIFTREVLVNFTSEKITFALVTLKNRAYHCILCI